jgi:hypothetical protein
MTIRAHLRRGAAISPLFGVVVWVWHTLRLTVMAS